MDTLAVKYSNIPTLEEATALYESHDCFTKSTQIMNECEVVSFKYNYADLIIADSDFGVNMRGITFVDGELAALPFPKFYNIGENKHSNYDEEDFTAAYVKSDGSLISFLYVGDFLELKTMKSVHSSVAQEAREALKEFPLVEQYADYLLSNCGLSPIFEYVSPSNRIVVKYDKTNFVFLGARNLETGEILLPHDLPNFHSLDFAMPLTQDEAKEYLKLEGVEGVVYTTKSGMMVKSKTAEYCRLHTVLTNFTPRVVLRHIYDLEKKELNDTVDDMISVLKGEGCHEEAELAEEIRTKFYANVHGVAETAKAAFAKSGFSNHNEFIADMFKNGTELDNPHEIAMYFRGKHFRIYSSVYHKLYEEYRDEVEQD